MLQNIYRFGLLTFFLLFAACASTPPVDPTDTTRSVIFGYIDMDDAPTSVDWVFVQQYDGTTDGYSIAAEDGIFLHVAVEPGPYQVTRFGGSGFLAGDVRYNFPDSGRNETALIVKQPDAYFMGSYKYEKVKTGFFEAGQFDMKPSAQPTEKDILQKILIEMRKEYPEYLHAIGLVEKRLAALR